MLPNLCWHRHCISTGILVLGPVGIANAEQVLWSIFELHESFGYIILLLVLFIMSYMNNYCTFWLTIMLAWQCAFEIIVGCYLMKELHFFHILMLIPILLQKNIIIINTPNIVRPYGCKMLIMTAIYMMMRIPTFINTINWKKGCNVLHKCKMKAHPSA